jgi:hypothetical protein
MTSIRPRPATITSRYNIPCQTLSRQIPQKSAGVSWEDVVNRDGLWTSLLTGLSITEWSDSPLSYKLRAFQKCCTVLDDTLSALEDSQKVVRRVPEHSLLSITCFFKGAFMGRTISFRVDIIKAQICKALLAQLKVLCSINHFRPGTRRPERINRIGALVHRSTSFFSRL